MKRSFKDHTAWVGVLAARQQTAEPVADDIMTKLHSAFKDLRAGSTDDDLFDRLAAAINVGLLRAEQIAPACVDAMLAARDALIQCDEIRGRHGRYGFNGPGLASMVAGLDLYEEMVRKSTPQQMRMAMTASLKRMRSQVAACAGGPGS